ncbi:MAG TPA: ATP-binding protein [Micropepsaceae bacterium]
MATLRDILRSVSRLIAALTAVVGLLVCLGWAAGIPALKSLFPGFPEMKVNSALAFIFAGLSLWLLNGLRFSRTAARAVALAIVVIALVTLVEYVFGFQAGIDQLIAADRTGDSPYPGRIPLTGAVAFALLGTALSSVDVRQKNRWPAQWLAILVSAISFAVILGYAYDVTSIYRARVSGPVALHGAILFFLLGFGVIFARPDRGITARMTAIGASGFLVRRLLPASLIIAPTLGWLRLQGEEAGLYDANVGLALFATANIAIFSGLIWHTAGVVHKADADRSAAEEKTRGQLARLDLLNHITRAIGERQDPRSIFQVVVRNIEDHLNVDFCCIGLYDRNTVSLTIESVGVRSRGLASELAMPENARISVEGNGLARAVEGVLVYEEDISRLPFPFPKRLSKVGLRALVVAPLITESSVAGVLIACRREPHSFVSSDCEFLRQLSEHVALSTHQSQLYAALKQAYDDLRQSQQTVMQQERLRALGQMSSGIAHDINNALTPAALYTEALMERDDILNADARQQLGIVRRALEDVANTVSRMKEFYGQRETQLRLQPVDLTQCLQHTVDLTRVRWRDFPQSDGIAMELKTDLPASLPNVMGVENEIRDGLTNLIFNAVDAMPQGGTLTVRTFLLAGAPDDSSSSVCVEVIDTGVGMDEDTRRRCMEPFFTTKGERGTGLGLAMVYGMAKRHAAELEVESAPGAGTTIRLVFPAAAQTAHAAAPLATGPVARLRVLLVDDDPILLQAMYETLTKDGHLVTIAEGGQAGIDTFHAAQDRGVPFDVAITDLGMPYVDGRKVAAALRAAAPNVHVILLTGWGQRLLAANDTPANVDQVLAKPPKLRELRAALAAASPVRG